MWNMFFSCYFPCFLSFLPSYLSISHPSSSHDIIRFAWPVRTVRDAKISDYRHFSRVFRSNFFLIFFRCPPFVVENLWSLVFQKIFEFKKNFFKLFFEKCLLLENNFSYLKLIFLDFQKNFFIFSLFFFCNFQKFFLFFWNFF